MTDCGIVSQTQRQMSGTAYGFRGGTGGCT